MTELSQLARELTAAKYKIIPCQADKTPQERFKWTQELTDNLAIIDKWFKDPSVKLLGIPCRLNNFFAVDVDPDGVDQWLEWVNDYGLPANVLSQRTPRGGWHYLFANDRNLTVPGDIGKDKKGLAPGIDLRGPNYICTGPAYTWLLPINTPLVKPPIWLTLKIKELTRRKSESINTPKDPALIPPPSEAAKYWLDKFVPLATVGSRNATGFNLCLQLRDSGLSQAAAAPIMRAYAVKVPQEPNNFYSTAEAMATLNEVYSEPPREPATIKINKITPKPPVNAPAGIKAPQGEAKITASPESVKAGSPAKVSTKEPTAPLDPKASGDPGAAPSTPLDQLEPPDFGPEPDELAPKAGRYQVRGLDFYLQERPPIPYQIQNLITAGSVNVWVGMFGSKKTWSAISACMAVAANLTWLGMEVQQSTVLFIDEESGEDRLSRRMAMAYRGMLIDHNIPVYSVSLPQFNLLKKPQDQDAITGLILNLGAKFVVIDALADIMAGGDENAVKDTQPVFMALRKIAETTKAAIIVIHHTNKMGGYRGSTAIPGAIDTMLEISSTDDTNLITFKTLKMRDGEPLNFAAIATWDEDKFYLTHTEIQHKTQLTKAQQFTLDYFHEYGDHTLKQLEDHAGDLYTFNTLKKAIQYLINNRLLARKDTNGPRTEATYGIPSID